MLFVYMLFVNLYHTHSLSVLADQARKSLANVAARWAKAGAEGLP